MSSDASESPPSKPAADKAASAAAGLEHLPKDELEHLATELGLEAGGFRHRQGLIAAIHGRRQLIGALDRNAMLDVIRWGRRPVAANLSKEQLAQEIVRIRSMRFDGLSQQGLAVLARLRNIELKGDESQATLVHKLKRQEGFFARLNRKRRALLGSIVSNMIGENGSAEEAYQFIPPSGEGGGAAKEAPPTAVSASIKEEIEEAGLLGGIAGRIKKSADSYLNQKLDEIESRIDRKLDEIDRRLGEWRDREMSHRIKILKITLWASVIVGTFVLIYSYVTTRFFTHSTMNNVESLIALDPYLKPYAPQLRDRRAHYQRRLDSLHPTGGLLGMVSHGHHYFGLNRGTQHDEPGIWYREWAPAARLLSLIGDFNGWDRWTDILRRDENGVWSIFLPDAKYAGRLVHGSKVKVHVISEAGEMDRIPAYIRRVEQESGTGNFTGVFWDPPPFAFRHPVAPLRGALRIYEAHVGMAQEETGVGSFGQFSEKILPRIAALGYNAVQLMAIMEHPYYGSFGYHVSNFYAVSSRFGTPEELKSLIDAAHGLGLHVLLDIIHSHAVKNTLEGLNLFDGTEYQYFHAGPRGQHVAWDSLLFDYGKFEVQRFLLSNVRYWLEEFHFDGLRFDGVTSMIYLDHGMGKPFTRYDDYFGDNVDADALAYLQMANALAHTIRPQTITVAEDVSGMIGMARPVEEGGVGFDYRLAMGVPDYWIKLLKNKRDEEWNLGELYHALLNRRWSEKHVGYVESHDQSLVGDKTIAFWLMDKEMYWHMNKASQSLVIDRGLALHKMIRLITFSLAGEAYLNFMGNEFGHPEWVDFPRPGNNNSYHYARRQWHLVDDPNLHYTGLAAFDQALMQLDIEYKILDDKLIEQLSVHEEARRLVYRRGPLVFVFNFHPTQSYTDLRIPVPDAADYRVVLNTDDQRFEGFGLVQENVTYPRQEVASDARPQSVQIYLPSRSAQVLAPIRF